MINFKQSGQKFADKISNENIAKLRSKIFIIKFSYNGHGSS